ncbi:LysR substrate-binding domain-containing protein [Xanthomonas theicola]|uniref:LysR substrate-binding domain-containing protein n=1 Tax=Xanthomonas theicola TaxID=56464 RepID=UPI0036218A47
MRPSVHLDLRIDHGEALGERWAEGAYDILVAAWPGNGGDPEEKWTLGLHWVCGIDDELDPDAPLDVIVYGEHCAWRRWMFDRLADAGRDFRVAVTSANPTAIAAAIENGLGAGSPATDNVRPDTMRVVALGPGRCERIGVDDGLFAARRQSEGTWHMGGHGIAPRKPACHDPAMERRRARYRTRMTEPMRIAEQRPVVHCIAVEGNSGKTVAGRGIRTPEAL